MADEKDIAEQIETLRADIASLTTTVSPLVADIARIQASLMHPAGPRPNRGGAEAEIERTRLMALFIALGFGIAIGRFTRK